MEKKITATGSLKRKVSGSPGFTIVEVLIAIFITGVVATAIYSLYTTFFRQSSIQDMTVEAQQNARVAIDTMERELINAGYAAGTADIITEATANSVQFIFKDPSTDTTMSATAGKKLKVKYALQASGGITYLTRTADNLSDSIVGSTEQVIPYVNALGIEYFDINGNQIDYTNISGTGATNQNNRNTIKFITVSITTQTRSNVPGTTSPKTFEVETHVRLRNIGVGTAATDSSPPAAPTGVQVRDPGQCGRLKVKWAENSEGDIAGYKIYYGIAAGSYTGVLNVPLNVLTGSGYSCSRSGGSVQCTINPSNPALSYTASTAAPGTETVYYVAVKAYDNSTNYSAYSSEASGNPDPSNSAFDSGSNDSTINPVKPGPVAGFAAASGVDEGTVALSWTGYNTTTYPDVRGFRIYRSESAFGSYPIDPTAAGIDWIAGEPGSGKPELTASATSYTDPGTGLLGCKVYYYAIAPVNCDDTLVPDNGGDPNSKKYIQTDYAATCGDGSTSCTPGAGFASVSGSDTAPAEVTTPAPPVINATAGWKRVAVSLTQSAATDLSQTCVYANDSATYPALQTDTGSYPKVNGCYQVDTVSTPNGRLIPDSGGIYTKAELSIAQSTAFWHDSMTEENPASPSLEEAGTYSYRAVAFDLCGNGSAVDAALAQKTTTLCGEDPIGKPPAVTNVSVACCLSPVTLSWTGVPSVPGDTSPGNHPDLAGYRIFRAATNDAAGWNASTLLNPSAPYWGTSYNDSTAAEGSTYYYRIVTTDCPYEKNNPTEAQIKADMISGYLSSVVGPLPDGVRPGKLDRDEKCPGAGSCTKDDHRAVITGVTMDNSSGTGTGDSTPRTDFQHHTVTMFLNNTSAGTMAITHISVSWVNSSAYLRRVTVGGGRSGMGEISTDIAQGVTTSVTGNPPYTSAVSEVALSTATIPAGARYVPITFRFKDSSDKEIDMRDDQLLIRIKYRNDTTSSNDCITYMTVSQSYEGVTIPFGPSVTAAQQNKPSSPTFGYAVPGATGLNTVPSGSDASIVVGSGVTVTISANVEGLTTDETTGGKVAVSNAYLYYRTTSKATTTAPTTGFNAVLMTNTSGNIWSASIPSSDGLRVWYYIIGTDADGNYDRDPEANHGAYVYDQESFNVCDVTPNAPTSLTATPSGADVALSWTAPAQYTTGANIDASDTIKYRIYRGGVQIGTDQTGTTYSDTGLAAGVYSYTVKAINSCASPGPNVSAESNTAAACVGASGQATITVSPTTIFRGQSYTVSIMDCLAVNGAYSATTETINVTSGFTGHTNTSTAPGSFNPSISESGPATGLFSTTITTTSDSTDSTKLLVLPADTITVYYPFASPTSKTVSVIVDPCTNTPKAPTGLSGSVQGQNITISWTAVTQNTDDSAIADLAGYRVYEKVCNKNKPDCTGADIRKDWFLRSTVTGAVTTILDADQGTVSNYIYYFKVTAVDSCSTPKESAYSTTWNETN